MAVRDWSSEYAALRLSFQVCEGLVKGVQGVRRLFGPVSESMCEDYRGHQL